MGRLGGTVYFDLNCNGVVEVGEAGIPNVTIILSNGAVVQTDANGHYLFNGLPDGVYHVVSINAPGFTSTGDIDGGDPDGINVIITNGNTVLGRDFYDCMEPPGGDGWAPSGQAQGEGGRVKLFYDPADPNDPYVNERGQTELPTLRLYGRDSLCCPDMPREGNAPVTAGSNVVTDTNTGRVPEDPPYTDPEGPFNPLSTEAPELDYVTWNPAWISEQLGQGGMLADWPCAGGADEVSRAADIRAGGINGSEKVWLRQWYEPLRLDKDLNADDCLTDADQNGRPDAPINPTQTALDEWYPAIMAEFTYVLLENQPPVHNPLPSQLGDSAPRPICGAAGGTQWVFPVGISLAQTDPNGPLSGFGLTSLDANFDGTVDMVQVDSERTLAAELGLTLDFDGDNVVDDLSTDGVPLSCDDMVVMHTNAYALRVGDKLQFLDHYVTVQSVSSGSALLRVWYTGSLRPRSSNMTQSVGIGAAVLAADTGPMTLIPAGGDNLGTVPPGAWFAYVQDVDPFDQTATVIVGRALGAPCASMESAPNVANRSPGGPWFLKRVYVDGVEYNTVAIMTCSATSLQYVTLRAAMTKVDATIEQHSVQLQRWDPNVALPLPPPFNYEHTVLGDVNDLAGFVTIPTSGPSVPRPNIEYMGGPIGPVPPVLGAADSRPYTGRDPNDPTPAYADIRASSWFYVWEDANPAFVGQLKEKYGQVDPNCDSDGPNAPAAFFYNEQVATLSRRFTEFFLPELDDPVGGQGQPLCDPDNYYVTSQFTNPTEQWRVWTMPDGGVPPGMPPTPPDLTTDFSAPPGSPRRASFIHDPDQGEQLFTGSGASGARLYGGPTPAANADCAERRSTRFQGAGDITAITDTNGFPVEVLPYTDPFAFSNPQHPDAPRVDSMTFDPAYMDEFRNSGEALVPLYAQISNNSQNAREKVYNRLWYEPGYITKIRFTGSCAQDLRFPAMMQEYTYLAMDTTDTPAPMPVGTSKLAFPVGTRAGELPKPNPGGTLPFGGSFGYGLTTFDGNFDGQDEAVTVHSEETLNAYLDTVWHANGPNQPVTTHGPAVDFDGDAVTDTLDADCTPMNGNEMVVFALESVVLDRDANTPEGDAAMFLDHLVTLEGVSRGTSAQLRFWFTGGGISNARPTAVRGVQTLPIGSIAIVDRFQTKVTILRPGQNNLGRLDGAWFAFVENVAENTDRVTLTVGRALGATHTAIDNGAGLHDLSPGDPWYLKRFYVDGHEYNVVGLGTQSGPAGCSSQFAFITIRTPVPKGNYFNPQDSIFQQGYFLNNLPPEMSVMPPFNVDHTVAVDVERIAAREFANVNAYDSCVGDLAPAGPLTETIRAEEPEPRFRSELREVYALTGTAPAGNDWEVHQTLVTPGGFTTVQVPDGQQYLITLNWRSPFSRINLYGCTRANPGPFSTQQPPTLTHGILQDVADCWRPGILPPPEPPPLMPLGGSSSRGGNFGNLPAYQPPLPPAPDQHPGLEQREGLLPLPGRTRGVRQARRRRMRRLRARR